MSSGVIPSLDCRDGKHAACTGDGWNLSDDLPTVCPCHCHLPKPRGAR